VRTALNRRMTPQWGVILLLFVPTISTAALDYNFLEASYLKESPDSSSEADNSGYQAILSAPLEAGNFTQLRYAHSKNDDTGSSDSVLSGGLGFYSPWQAGVDIYGLLSYEKHKQAGVKDSGYSGELGVRWLLGESLEINGGGQYLKLGDRGESVTWLGGLNLRLAAGIALAGRYENAEGSSRYTVGLRFLPR
jgi:hypothetical protein